MNKPLQQFFENDHRQIDLFLKKALEKPTEIELLPSISNPIVETHQNGRETALSCGKKSKSGADQRIDTEIPT